MKRKTVSDMMLEALKRARKESRDREIELYGHPINYRNIYKNKKIYSRKRKHPGVDLSFKPFGKHCLE